MDFEWCSEPREQTHQVYPTFLEKGQIFPKNGEPYLAMQQAAVYQTGLKILKYNSKCFKNHVVNSGNGLRFISTCSTFEYWK